MPGREEALIARINEWFPIIEKYGVKVIGIFQTVVGNSNEISYMLVYEDLVHRQRVLEAMEKDEDRIKMHERLIKEEPVKYNIVSKLLRSTEYSSYK